MKDLVPIILFISIALTLFGTVYIRSRENMALIERGINPRQSMKLLNPFYSLKYGLLLIGAGIGLAAAFLADMQLQHEVIYRIAGTETKVYRDGTPLYFAFIGIGGGLGLVISYLIEHRALKARPQLAEPTAADLP